MLVPLVDAVTGSVPATRPRFDAKGISFTVNHANPVDQIMADPDRLARLLCAVLDHADDIPPQVAPFTVATTRHDNRCQITSTDTGEGFDPDQGAHLFEPFYRGHSSRTASGARSGVGLAIAKAIVTAHHGALKGHSDGPGNGRTIRDHAASRRSQPLAVTAVTSSTSPDDASTTSQPCLCRTNRASLPGRA